MNPILLQASSKYFKQADPKSFYTGMIILGALIVFGIIANIIHNQGRGGTARYSGTGSRAKAKPGSYRKGTFRRQAKKLGLQRPHINTLEHIIKRYKVANPFSLLKNSPYLDRYLKKLLQDLDMMATSPAVKESHKHTVFRIKQIIERNSKNMKTIAGTRNLSSGQELSLSTADTPQRMKSRVLGNLKDVLAVEIPRAQNGLEVRWKKWTPVQGHFWKGNGQGFSFATKIAGYSNIHGQPCVYLQHSKTSKQAQQRRFRRKELDRPCYFYLVKILTSGRGRNMQKRAFVDTKRRALGTIIEISSGGCSIKSGYPLQAKELIKIQFDTGNRKTISVFGKVQHVQKIPPRGGIMHIMFTKVSRSHLNQINEYVYNYENADLA